MKVDAVLKKKQGYGDKLATKHSYVFKGKTADSKMKAQVATS